MAMDAVAALALVDALVAEDSEVGTLRRGWTPERLEAVRASLESFRGSRRRSEIVGESGGVLVMDDYGHHPTAIRTTLRGLKSFYPQRRLVVSFMSHTYTRTAALLDEFASSFADADILFLHRIYGSAREQYSGGVDGHVLFERTKAKGGVVHYVDEPLDALDELIGELKEGDLFLTLGAGDNWKLGRAVLEALSHRSAS